MWSPHLLREKTEKRGNTLQSSAVWAARWSLQSREKQKQEPADSDENSGEHDNHTRMGETMAQPSSLHFFHVKSQSSWYPQHLGMGCGDGESPSASSINWSMIWACYHNAGGWIHKLVCSVLNLDCRGKRGNQPNGQSSTAIVLPSAQSRPNSSLENNQWPPGKQT